MSKKWLIVLLIIIVAVGGFIYYLPYSKTFTRSTDLSHEATDGVTLHDNIHSHSFVKRFGKPIEQISNENYDYFDWKNGLETASVTEGKHKGDIMRIIITGSEGDPYGNALQTKKGIKLGDTLQQVIQRYGDRYYKGKESGLTSIGYIDRDSGRTIEFRCEEGERITEIRLDDENL
ncbi:hypothetical protein A374_06571 [Fictibacillus macauensis ZFHKF-1]|uniref:Uncharacterized protein n=1 Tax=Fictibacillus macauensis ZFHKF-1 TaxID=1196324 RepID=I8AK72_9BACL|nr:hypothetical protein [Fictibacillus macauensis]EIT86242.1 hypothetical protein A374_06571 [Fictibacillus macauensis ZFHKF-1]